MPRRPRADEQRGEVPVRVVPVDRRRCGPVTFTRDDAAEARLVGRTRDGAQVESERLSLK